MNLDLIILRCKIYEKDPDSEINDIEILRHENRRKLKRYFEILNISKKQEPSWFGLPILINKKYLSKKKKYIEYLNKKNIETRPILSGNFMNQKSIDLYNLNPKKLKFINSQEIEERGFFIGLHTKPISNKDLNFLVRNLLKINRH